MLEINEKRFHNFFVLKKIRLARFGNDGNLFAFDSNLVRRIINKSIEWLKKL